MPTKTGTQRPFKGASNTCMSLCLFSLSYQKNEKYWFGPESFSKWHFLAPHFSWSFSKISFCDFTNNRMCFFKKFTQKTKANNNPSTSRSSRQLFRSFSFFSFVVGLTTDVSRSTAVRSRRHFERSARIFVIEPFHDIRGVVEKAVWVSLRSMAVCTGGNPCMVTWPIKKHEHDLSTDRWKPMTSLSLKGFKGGFNKHIRLSNQSTIDLVAWDKK